MLAYKNKYKDKNQTCNNIQSPPKKCIQASGKEKLV